MKLKTDLQKLYSDLLNEIVAAKKDTLCLHCAHEKKNHKEIPTMDGADDPLPARIQAPGI